MKDSDKKEILQDYLDTMNPSIRESLNYEQKKEISQLIQRLIPKAFSRHLIDLRFTFWLIRNWYVVLLFGRDHRLASRTYPGYRKNWLEIVLKILLTIVIIVGILGCLFMLLYMIKSFIGIDIFPDKHLRNLL